MFTHVESLGLLSISYGNYKIMNFHAEACFMKPDTYKLCNTGRERTLHDTC